MHFLLLGIVVGIPGIVVGKNVNRPQLLPYDPTVTTGAAVIASDGMARFTVLTPKLVRMEYAYTKNLFEDRASLAVLQRKLDLPHFTSAENNGVLTIVTDEVILKYTVGKGFSADTLTVQPATKDSTFPGHVVVTR
eukprot:gene21791-27883_t